jgi:hypothetical protein
MVQRRRGDDQVRLSKYMVDFATILHQDAPFEHHGLIRRRHAAGEEGPEERVEPMAQICAAG